VMAAILVTALSLFGDNLKDLFTAVAEELGDAAKVLKEED